MSSTQNLITGNGEIPTDNLVLRAKTLRELRTQRSRNRANEVLIGTRLQHMLKQGSISKVEYDYVMGFSNFLPAP